MMKKNDEHDAYCVAAVRINQLHTLPDAKPEDNHWTLSQLVNRKDTFVKGGYYAEKCFTSKVDPKGTTGYVYDKLNRLKKVTEPDGKITEYSFDRAGNRSAEVVTLKDGTVTATSYTHNEQGRLLSTESKVNNERHITKYSYDNNRNLINNYSFAKIETFDRIVKR